MTEFSVIAIFFVGLLGGVHCLGMCGSIVGILTSQLPKVGARWPYHLAYNVGRISSYTLAGLLVGAVGQAGLLLRDVVPIQHLLFGLSSLMLIALGLYLAGIWYGAAYRAYGHPLVETHTAIDAPPVSR